MAKLVLRKNGQEADIFPLMMTVGVLDQMALKGYTANDIPLYFRAEGQTIETDMDHGIEFILMTAQAAQQAAIVRDGADPDMLPELPSGELLRLVLTPGQVWDLCDHTILDSLVRTVEAAPEKNERAQ